MRAGRLRNNGRVDKNTPTRSASGETVDAWTTHLASWWFDLAQVGGGETFRSRQVHADANHVASGRYVTGVTAQMRLVLGSRTFDILRVDNVANRDRELMLHLVERGI